MDNLRTAMVAWIIAGHALLGYAAIGGWPYAEVAEGTFDPRVELVLCAVLGPSALFVIGSFFFLSGLVSGPALARKGPARFAADRALRLGLPCLAFVAVVWPLFMWFAYRAAGHDVSYWWMFRGRRPFLDPGPLWFAEVLLYVSLGYALWASLRRPPHARAAPLRPAHLVTLAVAVTVGSFVVRLWFPARSIQVLGLHLWQWPGCVAMFGFGVAAARRGWQVAVPRSLYRACGWAVAATVAAAPVLAAVAGVSDVARDAGVFLGGWHWQALALDGVEATLVVAGSIWLLGLAQHRLASGSPVWAAWARGSYAAFVLQAPVLLTLAIAARPLAWPAEAKAALVAAIGVPACFRLAGVARGAVGSPPPSARQVRAFAVAGGVTAPTRWPRRPAAGGPRRPRQPSR